MLRLTETKLLYRSLWKSKSSILKGWLPNAKLKKYKKELSDLGATWVS